MTPADNQAFDVCVLGSFMKDLVAQAPRRPGTGETLRGLGFYEALGGKGLNQAVAAARSGARVAMVGRLGADRYGEEFLLMLAQEGIDASHVRRDEARGTGVGLPVVEPSGANSIIIVPRANDAVTVADVEAAAGVIRSSRILLVQLELPVDAVVAALRLARAAGVVTVLNPAPYAELPGEIAELVDVLVPNEVEAEQLTGLSCRGDAALGVAMKLRGAYAGAGVVVTLGGRGVIVADREDPAGGGRWRINALNAYDVDVVDTVGAGDAFCGALAARLAGGDGLLTAAEFAVAAGALAVTRHGAAPAMPDRAEITGLLYGPGGAWSSRHPAALASAPEAATASGA
ncbi:ribokinase [Catellatospora bangladeshensis]|uniref:Deoxyribokinase n=1 Tax=Catellatospora bangladeshensis TaxID=310355 RepID=A0A8J3JSX9_9ACTN|nr:ribokinase [Catellatospora bangladeshensis]GIF86332.1 ribokinase [Catellatospora bangladeshensis]